MVKTAFQWKWYRHVSPLEGQTRSATEQLFILGRPATACVARASRARARLKLIHLMCTYGRRLCHGTPLTENRTRSSRLECAHPGTRREERRTELAWSVGIRSGLAPEEAGQRKNCSHLP